MHAEPERVLWTVLGGGEAIFVASAELNRQAAAFMRSDDHLLAPPEVLRMSASMAWSMVKLAGF
jgi:hypothetical protein